MLLAQNNTRLSDKFSGIATHYPEQDICQVFEAMVTLFPKNIAIEFTQTITYEQLNAEANQLAHYLKAKDFAPESLIAFCLPPGPEMIVTLLGILKAGYAYIPLSPKYSVARLQHILRDSQASWVITKKENWPQEQKNIKALTFLEDLNLKNYASENLPTKNTNRRLANVRYTSGSTGVPKGVMVEHRGIVRLVKNTNYMQFTPQDIIAQVTNITFDVSEFEIWGALLNGGTLVIPAEETLLSASQFAKFLHGKKISILWLTARLFDQHAKISPEMFADLTYLLVGGEVLDPKTIFAVLNCKAGRPKYILNGYGPTENSVFTTVYKIPDTISGEQSIPIGVPVANTSVCVVNEHGGLADFNEPGELWTGGDGVARGYLNNRELTLEKFIVNPFTETPTDILYKTGDIVYWRKDGNLEYVGRVDNQVKIFGQRIELGEIEKCLLKYNKIHQVIVLPINRNQYEKSLSAYVILNAGCETTPEKIKAFLSKELSSEKIPETIFILDRFPLNISGKVDREMLERMALTKKAGMSLALPKTAMQKKLLSIWETVLKIDHIGLDDDFFDLGGHSILLIRLHDQISKVFHYEIPVAELFSAQTIRKQANILEKQNNIFYTESLVAFPGDKKKLPVFLLPPVNNKGYCFFPLIKYLIKQQPVYALFDPSDQMNQCQFKTLEAMAEFFCEIIVKTQPKGPYQLIGYSFGTQLAIAISRIFIDQGEQIKFLGLIDGWAKFPDYCLSEKWFRHRMALLEQKMETDTIKVNLSWHRMQMLLNTQLAPLPVKVTLFKSTGDQGFSLNDVDEYNHWLPWAANGIERYLIPGDHDTMLSEPYVQELAKVLQDKLNLPFNKKKQ